MSATQTKLDKTKVLLTETKKANKQLKRENKRLKQMLKSNENSKKTRVEKENTDLKKVLQETKAVNKQLKQQNKRQKQVWFALQQMCKALEGFPIGTNVNKSDKSSPQTKQKNKFRIQLISMSSKLKRSPTGDKYNVSVKYTAKGKPGVQWTVFTNRYNYGIGGKYVTSGWTEYMKSNKTYVSGIELNHDLLLSYFMNVRIYDAPDFVALNINMSEILKQQTNEFEKVQIQVHAKSKPIIAPANSNMTVSFDAIGNFGDISSVEVYMSGLDYSVHPPRMFEVGSFSDDIRVGSHKISNSSANISITVQQHLSENGGILSLAIARESPKPRLFEKVQYGKAFDVLSNITKTVLRPDTVGLFPLENVSVVYPPLESIICGAMGFEQPDIALVKETVNGPQEIQHDVYVEPDKHMVIKTFTIDANDTEAEGNYSCIASIKKKDVIVSSQTKVVRFEPSVIIETGTGVIANNSEFVKIMCTATGYPEPTLELRLYDEYGPDLSKSSRFKTAKSNPEPRTTVLVVTIEPVIRDIFKVYCVAVGDGYEEYKDIEIFPEPVGGPNWELRYDLLDNNFLNSTLI